MPLYSTPELLESRIAPAAFVSAFAVQYVDGDGDLVTVKSTRPVFHDDLREFTFVPEGVGERLQMLTLGTAARGANFTISAEPIGGGAGLAIVGAIESNVDLGNVTVDGTLGHIVSGDARPATPGLLKLTVDSLGGVPGVSSVSEIRGHAGVIAVAGDISGASVHVMGNLVRVTVGGSLLGGAADASGSVRVDGRLTLANVSGSVVGGDGLESGAIFAGVLTSAIVRGDLRGGGGDGSGQLFGGTLGSVTIGGDVVGGSATEDAGAPHHGSGMVLGERSLASISVAGSVIGGAGAQSGAILSGGPLRKVVIQNDLLGGAGDRSGVLRAEGDIGLVKIHGSVIGDGSESGSIRAGMVLDSPGSFLERSIQRIEIGGDVSGGDSGLSGFIEAPRTLGFIKVGGSVIGGAAENSGMISAARLGYGAVGGEVSGTIKGGSLGTLQIAGSLLGGAAGGSGQISFNETAQRIFIGGDVAGGLAGGGSISVSRSLGALEIGGSLIAGDAFSNARIESAAFGAIHLHGSIVNTHTTYSLSFAPDFSGAFFAGRIGSLVVDGGISASPGVAGAPPVTSYAVVATGKVGSIVVGGLLHGSETNRIGLAAGALVVQAGRSYGNEPAPAAAGFGRIEIRGSVSFAEINAGTEASNRLFNGSFAGNPDARIGSIIARGSWTASTVTVGAQPGPDGQYGTGDDSEPLPANSLGTTRALSQLGSIVIVGRVTGTAVSGDQFAIQAQRIGSATISGVRLPLTSGLDDFQLDPINRDVRLRELSA